ncbi:hypothetical protein ACQJBY_047842 [Aegilops geniculata]
MVSYSTGRPGSTFGLTRRTEVREESAMQTPELRVRWLTGVSWGSGLTGRRQEEPDEEEDAPGSMRLGVHELPRRRERRRGERGTPAWACCRPRCTRRRPPACGRARPTIGGVHWS